MSIPMPVIPLVVLALAPQMLAGCTHPVNARLRLGALDTTPTFRTTPAPMQPLEASTPRERWNTTVIIAPIDGIAHGPTLRFPSTPRKKDPPRMYGLLPTATTALQSQSASNGSGLFSTLDELGASLTTLIDPFLIHYELTTDHWSPRQVWKRTRQDTAWATGPLASDTNDDVLQEDDKTDRTTDNDPDDLKEMRTDD